MLPSTINEIGGERIYAWVTTLYLVGSVVAAATVNALLHRIGACISFVAGFAVLGAGSLVCAAAPNMEILLLGRLFQGLSGGLLCGLSFAVINAVLPRRLWSRGSALTASTWGVGALLGPALGGFFAQFGAWRWAFGLLALLSIAMATLAPGLLTTDGAEQPTDRDSARIPIPSVDSAGHGRADGQCGVAAAQHSRDSGAADPQRPVGRRVSGGRPPDGHRCAARQRLRLRAAEVGLSDTGFVGRRDQGGPLCAVVRPAAGASRADRRRAARRCVVAGLDDQRLWQRLAEQGPHDRGRGDRRAAGDGGRSGAGRDHPCAGRDGRHRHHLRVRPAGRRGRYRRRLAAPVGVGDERRRRPCRGRRRRHRDQLGPADFRRLRRGAGRCCGEPRRRRRSLSGTMGLRRVRTSRGYRLRHRLPGRSSADLLLTNLAAAGPDSTGRCGSPSRGRVQRARRPGSTA